MRPVILLCVVALGCGPPPAPESPSRLQRASLGEPASAALVVGCWSLHWNVRSTAPPAAALPDSVLLREEVVFGTPERLLAPATHPSGRTHEGSGERPWEARFVRNRWWIEDDALRMRFSDGGEEAWHLALGIETDDLVGTARYTADGEREDALRAGVRATRIECLWE